MSRYGPRYEYNWLNSGANFCPMNFFSEKDSKKDSVLICQTYYKFSKKSCLWWSKGSTYFKLEWVFFPKKDLNPISLDIFRTFAYFSSYLQTKSFALKQQCLSFGDIAKSHFCVKILFANNC